MRHFLVLILILLSLTTACSVLTLQPANFSWPLESVLPIDENGNVSEKTGIHLNSIPLDCFTMNSRIHCLLKTRN